jgi:hypothetical protein
MTIEQLGMASINRASVVIFQPNDVGCRWLGRRRQLRRE